MPFLLLLPEPGFLLPTAPISEFLTAPSQLGLPSCPGLLANNVRCLTIIGQLASFFKSTLEKLVLAAHQLGREPDQAASYSLNCHGLPLTPGLHAKCNPTRSLEPSISVVMALLLPLQDASSAWKAYESTADCKLGDLEKDSRRGWRFLQTGRLREASLLAWLGNVPWWLTISYSIICRSQQILQLATFAAAMVGSQPHHDYHTAASSCHSV